MLKHDCSKCYFCDCCDAAGLCDNYYPIYNSIEEYIDSDEFQSIKSEYYDDYIDYLSESVDSI